MMESIIRKTLRVALVFCISGEMLIAQAEADIPAFCTMMGGQDLKTRDIVPMYMNASEFPEPPSDARDLMLEICPNNTTLKISWRTNKSNELNTWLCYQMKSIHDGQLLQKNCIKFFVEPLETSSITTCWFPMEFITRRPIISAVAKAVEHNRTYDFYGQINTSWLDPKNSCGSKDICEVTMMETTKTLISCYHTSFVFFDDRVKIKAVWFDGIDSSSCKNFPVSISGRTSNKLEYSLNCTHHGLGHIKILYTILDKHCLKYQRVRVICDNYGITTTTTTFVTSTDSETDDFTTFVVFGVICMIVITGVVVIIIVAAQRLRLVFRTRLRYSERSQVISNGSEGVPLHLNNFQDEGPAPAPVVVNPVHPVDKVIKKEYLKRVDSMSSEGQTSMASSVRGQNVRKLHRSVTVALLENTETFYRKKILFLPTPFDTFSRDATNLLKAVFTLELNIPTQCCFDRDVYQQYMTSNRYEWIENHLGDYDRILIFLCFTTIRGENRESSMVSDVLDHILLSRIRPHCKVAFLHLTDSSENLEKNHHGDSFHLSDKSSYTNFVGEVLNYCGRNPFSEPDLLYRLTNCETSKHFMGYIGIRNV